MAQRSTWDVLERDKTGDISGRVSSSFSGSTDCLTNSWSLVRCGLHLLPAQFEDQFLFSRKRSAPINPILLPYRAQPCRRSNAQSKGDQPTSATVLILINLQESRRCFQSFQTLLMPKKDRPLVDRHPPKNGVGWLVNAQQGKVCSFTNDSPTTHAQ